MSRVGPKKTASPGYKMSAIAFLTDFGIRDWFVGAMKGVALGIAPNSQVVDITHHVQPGDIRSASFVLKSCHMFYPEGTVFVVVVDPGVGSTRRILCARGGGRYYVGPDNGVLSQALENFSGDISVWNITNDSYFLHPLSATFHGRDIFTPVGAHLAAGVLASKMGSLIDDYIRMPLPKPVVKNESILGEIIYIDRFGNAFSNIDVNVLSETTAQALCLHGHDMELPIGKYYTAVDEHEPLGLINSEGYMEVAVNKGNAAKMLGLSIGDPVVVKTLRGRRT